MSKLNSRWLGNKTNKDRETAESLIRNSTAVLIRLREILDEELKSLETTGEPDYDKASWAYYQADVNGQKRALRKIKQLTDHLETK